MFLLEPAPLLLQTSTEVEASKLAPERAADVGRMTRLEGTEAAAACFIIVALLMKTNDWYRPHHSSRLISHQGRGLDYICTTRVCARLWRLTTSRMSLLTSKLGFFFMLRMTQLWIMTPPHSTCRLGELTLAIWKLFRLRTPHARI